jgi:glycosyltransferase involved in cell wall biosynthesis
VKVAAKLLVLIDGWSLIYQPNGLAAGHLLTLLTCQPEDVEVALALPGEPPEWLRGKFNFLIRPMQDSARQRFVWEQRRLPALAKELQADLVHLSSATPALFANVPNLLSPADADEPVRSPHIYPRLRQAFSAGGMAHLAGRVWPSDLPAPSGATPVFRVSPALPFGWFSEHGADPEDIRRLDLPETFILYHGASQPAALRFLLETFRWAAGPVGENYPLLILGLDEVGRKELPGLLATWDLHSCVQALPVISPFSIPWLYRKCSVLFHPVAIAPWGNPVRNALALGKPVVAGETTLSDALVGPAAYLAALDQPRELGAALLTVIVEEGLADRLAAEAMQRAASWQTEMFRRELGEVYRML